MKSNGFNEEDDLVAFFLAEVAETENRVVGIACAAFPSASVPHDCLDDIASTAVVKSFNTSSALSCEASSPEWCGAAPARPNVVLHPKSVLNEVGIGPNLLIGIARHVVVGKEELGGVLDVVVSCLP